MLAEVRHPADICVQDGRLKAEQIRPKMWGELWETDMKGKGPHPQNALSALKVKSLKAPGRYADGNGLYLVVDPSGAKRWLLRTVVHGKRRDIGLGSAALVPLADAREEARQLRYIARSGGDPLAAKKKARAKVPTFEEAAKLVHAEHAKTWKNAKHADQWINTLSHYAFPILGTQRIDHIETPDLLKVLSPIWLTKPETARRVKQRLRTVLDWGIAAGFRKGGNPADSVSLGLPKQPDRKGHFGAIAYKGVGQFVRDLRASQNGEVSKLAFEFLILTAARTSEVLAARWAEVDFQEEVWTIPASRMKAGEEHRVPLSPRAVAVLERARELSADSELLFPGKSPEKPLSNMTLLMMLRRMKRSETVHGFRSAFRDWAAERTNFPREVCERALAHTVKNKVEAAYQRGDMLEKRRKLMETWANFIAATDGEVVALNAS